MCEKKLHMFCIGHTNLSFNVPETAYVIRTSQGFMRNDAHNNLITLDELSEELSFHYPYLGGTAGILAIPYAFQLRNIPYTIDDRIMLFQQSKVVTIEPVGYASASYATMRIVSEPEAMRLNLENVAVNNENYLFPQIVNQTGGELKYYARTHHLQDYLKFCALAIDESVLSPSDVLNMCNNEPIIPGGGMLGIMPLGVFLDTVEKLKRVATAFLNNFRPGLYSTYERIAVGYCVERLSSFLIIKKLEEEYNSIPDKFKGHMITASSKDYIPGSSTFNSHAS